jgi:HK97 gp10 family phage protein
MAFDQAAMLRGEEDFLRLALALEAAAVEVPALASGVMRQAGDNTVKWAKELAPVRTGDLKNSIGVVYDTSNYLWFEAGPTAPYGGYVEYGTVHMAPHPYMGPAFERAVFEAIGVLEDVIGRIL